MAKRAGGAGRSRMDLRREAEALESRERGAEDVEETEDEDEEDDEDEEEEGEEAEGEVDDAEADGDDDDDGDDEDGVKKKKKKAKKVAKPKKEKAPAKSRKRTVKEVRRRAVWKVLDNGGKTVGTFQFNQKEEAEALLAAKIEEKKTTFYLQLIKEEITE